MLPKGFESRAKESFWIVATISLESYRIPQTPKPINSTISIQFHREFLFLILHPEAFLLLAIFEKLFYKRSKVRLFDHMASSVNFDFSHILRLGDVVRGADDPEGSVRGIITTSGSGNASFSVKRTKFKIPSTFAPLVVNSNYIRPYSYQFGWCS